MNVDFAAKSIAILPHCDPKSTHPTTKLIPSIAGRGAQHNNMDALSPLYEIEDYLHRLNNPDRNVRLWVAAYLAVKTNNLGVLSKLRRLLAQRLNGDEAA